MWPIMSCLWLLKSSKLIEAFFGILRLLMGHWGLFWYNVGYWGGLLRPIMGGWGLFWYDAGHCIVVGLWGPLWVVEGTLTQEDVLQRPVVHLVLAQQFLLLDLAVPGLQLGHHRLLQIGQKVKSNKSNNGLLVHNNRAVGRGKCPLYCMSSQPLHLFILYTSYTYLIILHICNIDIPA